MLQMVRKERLPPEGMDGAVEHVRHRTARNPRQAIRARPGTFEARYSTSIPGSVEYSLYEAGNQFAWLCERAGHDAPHGSDWGKVGHPQWRGVSDPRLEAVEELQRIIRVLGGPTCGRLMHYCVYGRTTRQIATIYRNRLKVREMATTLGYDLGRAAICFRLVK